jgi:ribose-phosphate pyrophosphokinase
LDENVREKHVIAVQSHGAARGKSMSDSLVEHLGMIDAARLAGATRITALAPNLAGTRQDRQAKARESVSSVLYLRMLRLAGVTDLVTVDPHSPVMPQEGMVRTTLTAQTLLREALAQKMTEAGTLLSNSYVMVSADAGHTAEAEPHADALGIELVTIPKIRDPNDRTKISRPSEIEGVDGKVCFMMDDMIDTAGTLVSAAETLERSGATDVYAAATHGFFSDPGIERLYNSSITQIFITDTLPVNRAKNELGDRLQVVSVADIIADSMTRIIQGRSVSETAAGQSYH